MNSLRRSKPSTPCAIWNVPQPKPSTDSSNWWRKENDHALEVLLHWYITEQVEEEMWSGELATLMQQFHQHPGQVFMLDHQWSKRVKAD